MLFLAELFVLSDVIGVVPIIRQGSSIGACQCQETISV